MKLNEVVFNVLHNCHSLTMNLFNSLEYLIVYLTTGILYQIYQILTITSKLFELQPPFEVTIRYYYKVNQQQELAQYTYHCF